MNPQCGEETAAILGRSLCENFYIYIQSTSKCISIAVTLANVFHANFGIFQ